MNATTLPMHGLNMTHATAPHPEDALIARLVAGEQTAFREMYDRHADDVARLARRFVYSDAEAEDVTQEVFVSAFRSIHRFRGDARLRTWLYRITINRALKRQRWWSRRREVGADALGWRADPAPAPDARAADREALHRAATLLNGLDAHKRTVLVLHELEGLDTREIAEILDCPRSTVLTRLARARAALITANRRADVPPNPTGERR